MKGGRWKGHLRKLDGRVEEEESQETKVSSRKAQAEAAVQETGSDLRSVIFWLHDLECFFHSLHLIALIS